MSAAAPPLPTPVRSDPGRIGRQVGYVLEGVAGQFLGDHASDVEEEVDVARAEAVVAAALEDDRSARAPPQLVGLVDYAAFARVADPAGLLGDHQTSDL